VVPELAAGPDLPGELDERRESVIDIMASWSLEVMEPAPEVLSRIRDYVNGDVTLEEAIARAKAIHAQ
jgi:hypothetical protein